jgi:hypothetical protein
MKHWDIKMTVCLPDGDAYPAFITGAGTPGEALDYVVVLVKFNYPKALGWRVVSLCECSSVVCTADTSTAAPAAQDRGADEATVAT